MRACVCVRTHKEESAHGLGGGQQSADAFLDLLPGVGGTVPARPSRRHDNRVEHDFVAVETPNRGHRRLWSHSFVVVR